jgi:hypothetical protein
MVGVTGEELGGRCRLAVARWRRDDRQPVVPGAIEQAIDTTPAGRGTGSGSQPSLWTV